MKEIITYSLLNNELDSGKYYENISTFSQEVIQNGEKTLSEIIDAYIAFIANENIETVRSREEYLLEILNFGVLWQLYSEDANKLEKLPQRILSELVELRRHGGAVKHSSDLVRGILATIFLKSNNNIKLAASFNKNSYEKFIRYLEATGEFVETVKRFDNFKKYLNTLKNVKLEEVYTSILAFSIWFTVRSEQFLGKYTINVDNFLKGNLENHRFKEDFMFCGRHRVEYHLNMVGAQIMNEAFREDFLKTKVKKLLLPICMRIKPEGQCKAVFSEAGGTCKQCSKECQVSKLTDLGKALNFQVLIIPHESNAFNGTKVKYGELGIIGVVCILNLINGGWKARSLNLVPQCVILDYCGCKQHWHEKGIVTQINTKELKEILSTRR